MDEAQQQDLVEAWIAFQEAWSKDSDETDARFWAVEAFNELADSDPEHCWTLILTVLDKKPSDKVIGMLAAGPLEDLLGAHGPRLIERVEEHAQKDPAFRHLLGGVWQGGMSDEIWARVQAVAATRW